MKKLLRKSENLLLISLFLVFILSGCRKEIDRETVSETPTQSLAGEFTANSVFFDSYVAVSWYNLMNRLIITTPGHTPPIVARELGYSGIALYESAVGGSFFFPTMAGQLNGLNGLPKRERFRIYSSTLSANAAMARILKQLFGNASPASVASIDSLESANHSLYSTPFPSEIVNRSRNFGYAIADAIFQWSSTDGGHQAYLNNFPPEYLPPVGDGLWVATPPLFQSAMLPNWGNNRVMVRANGIGPIDPPVHLQFSTAVGSGFYQAANLVYTARNNLTAEQKEIANFWADGGGTFSPPGHNISIAVQIVRNKKLNLGQAAVLLAKVGIALNDAGVVCWRAKFKQNLMRPVTYIRNFIDPNWSSFIGTPPFPAYTSGHSTFSGATARILSLRFGNHFAFTDSTKLPYGFSTRSFNSFNQAAQEAAISRLYGGIHYEFDNDEGLRCGIAIANNVERLRWER